MDMNVETIQANVPVTVIKPHGRIDGSNYQQLIEQGGLLYQSGTRCLVLDMSDVSFLSSAGLVALHTLVLVMSGQKPVENQDGWHALADIERDTSSGAQTLVKLVNPQPKVANTLQMAGMESYFEVFSSTDEAVASIK